jgi:hypothetical protein
MLSNLDSCRRGTTLFVSGYYYWQDLSLKSALYIKVINILFTKISKEDPAIPKTVILLSPRVKRHRDTKIPNATTASDLTLSLKKPARRTTPRHLIPRAPITPSSLRYQAVNSSIPPSPSQLGRSTNRSNRGGSMLTDSLTIATTLS